jgi:hypothetical protein
MFNVNQFSSTLKGGGARAALFSVQITNPVNGISDIKTPFMVRAAEIPGLNVAELAVPYMGRQIKLAGNRTYDNWTPTIMNDEDFLIRNALEHWNNAINSFEGNLTNVGGSAPSLYKSNAQVTQYSKTGEILRVYDFIGLWPSVISPIALGWEQDAIEEYQVTFAYDYWRIAGGVTGSSGGI